MRQQRRAFFEAKMEEAKNRLTNAQIALQASGYNPDAIKADPSTAAQSYARLRAEVTAGEAKLQSLRRALADSAPEVQAQEATLATLRSELTRLEQAEQPARVNKGSDYISKVREYKYQEALFILDWSWGKLYAVHLKPEGSSYTATREEFLSGAPLPLTDAVIHPQDGAMYFAIGGRKVQSGLYRVTYTGKESTAATKPDTTYAAARATRKSLEAFHGKANPKAVATVWPYLNSQDPIGSPLTFAFRKVPPCAGAFAHGARHGMPARAGAGDRWCFAPAAAAASAGSSATPACRCPARSRGTGRPRPAC